MAEREGLPLPRRVRCNHFGCEAATDTRTARDEGWLWTHDCPALANDFVTLCPVHGYTPDNPPPCDCGEPMWPAG